MRTAPHSDAVLLGEVLSHTKNSLELRVIESWRGTEIRETVRLWGDNGEQCRPYVSEYPIGTTWVFALSAVTPELGKGLATASEETEMQAERSEYVVSVCGEYSLQVYAGSAMGVLRGKSRAAGRTGISLARLRSKVARWP